MANELITIHSCSSITFSDKSANQSKSLRFTLPYYIKTSAAKMKLHGLTINSFIGLLHGPVTGGQAALFSFSSAYEELTEAGYEDRI